VNLVGDGLHNFIDGLIIAGSFAVSIEVGLATAIAVTLHEIPQEIGDFGVLIYSGIKIKKGLFYNFLSALAAVLGLLVYILLGSWVGDWSKFILMFAGGGFIYIAVADLIPEMKHTCSRKKALGRLFIMLCGVGLMYLLTVLHVE
jgi:zinc and cadmium transporter